MIYSFCSFVIKAHFLSVKPVLRCVDILESLLMSMAVLLLRWTLNAAVLLSGMTGSEFMV